MRSHSDERPYKCETCDYRFKTAVLLADHIVTHTKNGAHKCIICGRSFNRSILLKRHMIIHSDERPFQCEYCGKGFKFSKNWKVHIRSHTGEHKHICDICGKSFVHYNSLRYHISKHNETGELKILSGRQKNARKLHKPPKTEIETDILSLSEALLQRQITDEKVEPIEQKHPTTAGTTEFQKFLQL